MGKPSDFFRADRFRSEARLHAGRSPSSFNASADAPTTGGTILPLHKDRSQLNTESGGLDQNNGRGSPSGSSAHDPRSVNSHDLVGGAITDDGHGFEKSSSDKETPDATSSVSPPPAPPPLKSEDASLGHSAIGSTSTSPSKPSIPKRALAGSKRFLIHTKNALFHSWVNILLVFVPVGLIVKGVGLNDSIIFAINAIAIIPLASLLTYATESVARRLGDTLGAFLNVSFGNAVELIIFIIALVKNEIRIVQASLLGSILSNLLLILGMAFLLGGLRYREQIYNNTVTQMSACLLSLSVMSLLLPESHHHPLTAFHASFNEAASAKADLAVLKVSRGTSVILLLVYVLYLLFQLKSHAYMYESTPQEIIDEESHPGVLADILGSSSSSDDSSSSDSSDSDASASGSIITTGKKIRKKMFKRRRRKSSASASSATQSSGLPSLVSSPSFNDRQNSNYLDSQPHRLGAIASGDEGEQSQRDSGSIPRVRDFVSGSGAATPMYEESKPIERKSSKKKSSHKHRKHGKKTVADPEKAVEADDERPAESQPKVEFADQLDIAPNNPDQSTSRLPFNMRNLSARAPFRPALPKMLSNNVFVQPSPVVEPARRPVIPRNKSSATGIRRTNSLPDRLNIQPGTAASHHNGLVSARTDPLPPFQHQRLQIIMPPTENSELMVEGDEAPPPEMSRTAACVLLLISTGLVAICAEFMVDAIPGMLAGSSVNQAFIGLIVLPIVSNAAEHVTAVTVAAKNKMDLAIGVAVGSSIQIALFVTPVVVLLGWILDRDMSLYFNLFETISLFVTAFVINFLILDGRSNYLEGSLLIAAYVIIAVGAFFYPEGSDQSAVGGAGVEKRWW
ncbi:vacuolar calcium ion transporter [Acrodontium crateriforme]|uniref:Vacuolar calcium ion transporter n=1 Tax=Acrodontium crateriforme TaxID=150365 RepID=A0AAQ3M631_9PEZI|nr:vacuolar calcium ion transporter [Acrodontium crateriforme]